MSDFRIHKQNFNTINGIPILSSNLKIGSTLEFNGTFWQYDNDNKQKLDGIESGAEVNNISDVDATNLTNGGDSTLHHHNSDRDRANHTGTQPASTISDFDTEVANNIVVTANTIKESADGSIDTHIDVDTTTNGPTNGQALIWNGNTWVPKDVIVNPAGTDSQIQFNNNNVFGSSSKLTFDGALNVTGAGDTGTTQVLKLINNTADKLLIMNDDGTFNGKNIAVGEYTGTTRIGEEAGPNATGIDWTAIGKGSGQRNTTGSNWTAVGSEAGRFTKGVVQSDLEYFENSTYIGANTKGTNGSITTLTNNETVVGYEAEGNGSNTVTIGSSAVTANYFNGDVHLGGTGTGIILTNPLGNKYRLTVTNAGTLDITAVVE